MSATVLSIADKKGSFDGSSCRPLDLCRQSPQHQIFAEHFNLVRQTLAAGLVGRVDVHRAIRFRRLRAFGESAPEIRGDVYQLRQPAQPPCPTAP